MRRQRLALTLVAAAVSLLFASASRADMDAAKRWGGKGVPAFSDHEGNSS